MTAAADFAHVCAAMADYFDGLHHSDTSRLRRVFHPQAGYYCATEGTLLQLDMARYFDVVDRRPSPASQGQPRTDRIVSIDFAGPVTAFVKARCSIPPRDFTDFLTLLRLDGRWQIVSKVFHYVDSTRGGGAA